MKNKTTQTFPSTDLVILAAGQSRRMQGQNKLLMCFEDSIQLIKIVQSFSNQIHSIWINSHRDIKCYLDLYSNLKVFKDEDNGFLGPLSGMKTVWNYTQREYVLFIPCDITDIPLSVVKSMHAILNAESDCQVVYLCINQQPLYPFCLMKRSAKPVIEEQIQKKQYSVFKCFKKLGVQTLNWSNHMSSYHSINSLEELHHYQLQINKIAKK